MFDIAGIVTKILIPVLFVFVFVGAVMFVLSQIPIDGMSSTDLITQHSVLSAIFTWIKNGVAGMVGAF